MFLDPFSNLGQVLVLLSDIVLLAQVDKVYDWFRGEEEERVDDFDLDSNWSARCLQNNVET